MRTLISCPKPNDLRVSLWFSASLAALVFGGCYSSTDEVLDGDPDAPPSECAEDSCGSTSTDAPEEEIPITENIPRNQLGEAVAGLTALDVLLVVDNSGSMAEEQRTLATSIYNLVTSLVNPVPGQGIGQAVDDVRIAVGNSDLGLQYAGTPGPSTVVSGCGGTGDDGALQAYSGTPEIELVPGIIVCAEGGTQCPTGWLCANGTCAPQAGASRTMACPELTSPIAGQTQGGASADLALLTACLAQVGTAGCGLEQQLEASVAALERNPELVRDDALLAVIVVSDEEDCSIEDRQLFETKEFADKVKGLNTACNFPAQNEDYLYPTSRYQERLAALKGREEAVLFAAFVGVPTAFEASCKGLGTWLGDCLDQDAMQLEPQEFSDPTTGVKYWHFRPACVRDDDPGDDVEETVARPGRRYVQVAKDFGRNGYLSSICDRSWKVSMQQVERMIAVRLGAL